MIIRTFGLALLAWLLVACSPPEAPATSSPAKTPAPVKLESTTIAMPDGVHLAVDLYMPADMREDERFPVLLEYLPYRKTESRSSRYGLFSYFVDRDYIVARVDIRGTGNSEGRLVPYEYSEQELDDGEAVIDWLSSQSFSNGNVGMFGISWGGFNSIQMAMRNPPALKAIIPVMATDDLYQDDVHFMDGIMHVDSYEIGQDVENMLPGAPGFELYQGYIEDRFDTLPWLLVYKSQQRDGDFWDRASLNSDYASIKIPTLVIGGWYDGYRDSVPRMLQHLEAPVKAIIGPWGHTYPNWPYPTPGIEWRHEAVRFYDKWLKGIENGVMDEPAFAVYVRDWHAPGLTLDHARGKWRWEDGWPIERGVEQVYFLGADGELATQASTGGTNTLEYVASEGIGAGGSVMWWGDFMADQAATDAKSLAYTSAALQEDIEILGFPTAKLKVSASAPLAHWFVRLSDVAPDGRVTQITGAGLNGARQNPGAEPRALVPGEQYEIEVELHFTSWTFRKGHRVRLSVSNAQWPMFWPTPYRMTTSLYSGTGSGSRLTLPLVPETARPVPAFQPIEDYPGIEGYGINESETVSGYAEFDKVERDNDGNAVVVMKNHSKTLYPWASIRHNETITHQTNDITPARSGVTGDYSVTVERPDATLRWRGVLDMQSDEENFHLTYTKSVSRNDELLDENTWKKTIKRDFQ